mgnify:CR=1 FL=1
MQSIRNIAIIAHVDHGKTTLVDKIIDQCKVLDERKERIELLLDNNDLERERGITILSKNVSVYYKDIKINIIDTPGHADFGGEVERVLKMADGVLLLVDAFEGAMPQTRFVLAKAIELGLKPIVVVNKVDKQNCTPDLVQEAIFDLMFNLDATEDQLDFVTVFGSSKEGWMSLDWQDKTDNILPLLDAIIKDIPEAPYIEGTTQMQITSLDYSKFVGRIAIGRIFRGDLIEGKSYMLCKRNGIKKTVRIKELNVFEGMSKKQVESARSGDICSIVGVEDFEIGIGATLLQGLRLHHLIANTTSEKAPSGTDFDINASKYSDLISHYKSVAPGKTFMTAFGIKMASTELEEPVLYGYGVNPQSGAYSLVRCGAPMDKTGKYIENKEGERNEVVGILCGRDQWTRE